MKIEQLLEKHKILKRDLMEYARYSSRSGFYTALKNKNGRIRIRHSLACYLIEKKCNLDLRQFMEAIKDD